MSRNENKQELKEVTNDYLVLIVSPSAANS